MRSKSICKTLTASAMLLFVISTLNAETIIEGGNVTGTWTVEGDPYTVQGDILVQSGESLSIEAGVTVRFDGPYSLTVNGILLVAGEVNTEENSVVDIDDVDWVVFTQHQLENVTDDDRWGGIRFDQSDPGSVIQYAIIEESFAQGSWPETNGGGLYISGSSPRVENSIIRNCHAAQFGGGVFIWSSSTIFQNNLIFNNIADISGGGMHIDGSNLELRNLTVVGNQAAGFGNGAFFGSSAEPYIRSSIFWQNIGDSDNSYYNAGVQTPDVKYCIFSDGAADVENFIWPNGFFPADTVFYPLSDSSRGIDNGDVFDLSTENEPVPNGGRVNMGAYGGTALSTMSQAVISPIHPASQTRPNYLFPLSTIRAGDSTSTPIGMANIGKGPMYVYFDSLEFVPPDTGEDFSDRFSIVPFSRLDIAPDSSKVFEIVYLPLSTDALAYITRIDTDIVGQDTTIDTTYATRSMDVILRVKSNGGNTDVKLRGTPIRPVMQLDITSLDFGTVRLGDSLILEFPIKNLGDTELTLGGLPSAYTNHFTVDDEQRARINPGSGRIYEVICKPIAFVDSLFDSLQIRNNHSMRFVQLEGFSEGPIMRTNILVDEEWERLRDSDTLDYLFVDLEESRTIDIVFHNTGNYPLRVNSIETTSNDFSAVLPGSANFPFSVAAGDSGVIGIKFDPSLVQLYDDSVSIYTSATRPDTDPSLTISVQGRGTTGGTYFAGEIPNPTFDIPEVWGEDGETVYICAGPTKIASDAKLTILDGVTVQFENDDIIHVEGTLVVLGKEESPVIFNTQPSGNSPHHGGVRYVAADSRSRMEWAIIENGRTQVPYPDEPDSAETYPDFRFHGGGIAVYNCSPSFYHVTVRNCSSDQDGGGIWIFQGAPTIVRCTVENNTAATVGGGLMFWGSQPVFHNNEVINNHAELDGGGIFVKSFSDPEISNTLIMGNSAGNTGGGLFVMDHSSPTLINSIFYENDADSAAKAIRAQSRSNPIMRNSIILGHGDDAISHGEGGNLILRYSVVEGMTDSENHIIDADPEDIFVDPVNGDFHPVTGSALVDAGDPASRYEDFSFPPSKGTSRADIGLYGGRYAGVWDGSAPVRLTFFNNSARPRTIKILVNVIGNINGDPTLEIETYDETIDVPLVQVSASAGVFSASYSVEQSTYLVATASANDGNYRFRRSLNIAVYKPSTGATLADREGAQLILPPHALEAEVLILGEQDIGASLPDGVPLAAPAGARWSISSTMDYWSVPAELILPYDSDMIDAGQEQGLAIWKRTGNEWERLESYIDPVQHTVHTSVFGTGTYVVVNERNNNISSILPTKSSLGVNYPNPFNPSTTIPFDLADAGAVEIAIFNVLGQEVYHLTDGWFTAGKHTAIWHGIDNLGKDVASGLYICRFQLAPVNSTNKVINSRKVVLIR
ncbi:MAG: hypothetical protein P9L92_02485 [Candidatus Electryonea clarkiae]|nr:hypothetical protein [Candidatus Electryonea clarkiae]MDP8285866.1 hypothetical protein [Candidatus Electryonea clarkiae]